MSYHHQLVSIFWTFFIDIVIQNKEIEILDISNIVANNIFHKLGLNWLNNTNW